MIEIAALIARPAKAVFGFTDAVRATQASLSSRVIGLTKWRIATGSSLIAAIKGNRQHATSAISGVRS
jgi:hypothetical protein